jgi:hypothetical protein
VRPKEARLQSNAFNPLAHHRHLLPNCHRSIATATGRRRGTHPLLIGRSAVTVDCLTGLFRHLEPDGVTGLLLAHGCSVDGVTMRSNVLHPQAHYVASSELAIEALPPLENRFDPPAPAPRSSLELSQVRPGPRPGKSWSASGHGYCGHSFAARQATPACVRLGPDPQGLQPRRGNRAAPIYRTSPRVGRSTGQLAPRDRR